VKKRSGEVKKRKIKGGWSREREGRGRMKM
jgi:hypothetical protein